MKMSPTNSHPHNPNGMSDKEYIKYLLHEKRIITFAAIFIIITSIAGGIRLYFDLQSIIETQQAQIGELCQIANQTSSTGQRTQEICQSASKSSSKNTGKKKK
jgi:hypothetical protein